MSLIRIPFLALALTGANVCAFAQQKAFDPVELQKGVLPEKIIQNLPRFVRWVDDENFIVNKAANPSVPPQFVQVNVKTGIETPAENVRPAGTGKAVFMRNGDVQYRDAGGTVTALTNDKDEEKNPVFSPDSNWVAYTKNNNLYTYDLINKKENQLTTDGTQTILNGFATWVYFEEIFGRPTTYKAFWWAPDSKTIAYMRFDENRIPMFPIYRADGNHGTLEETRYPKAGDPNPDVKLGFVQATGGATTWADFNSAVDHQLGWPKWTPDGSALYVQWQNRGQDSLRMFAVKPDGSKTEVYFETQKTWTDLSEADNRLTFINGGKDMLIQSDKTGWNHLYLYAATGQFKNAVTSGDYRVQDVKHLDEKEGRVYFTARGRENSARTDLYSIKLNGKDLRRITFGDYNHTVELSPNAKNILTTYSNATTPVQMATVDNKGKTMHVIVSAKDVDFDRYPIAKTELIRIKSADGKFELPALVTWPANMDPNKRYPMLVSVYGGPDAGTVMDRWTWNATRQWYAQEGLIQVAFDHRASGHFGKAGVNYMHRNLGYWEMEDYKTMAKWFIEKGYADSAKICMTGFSYGGYMSCYAVTYGADVFKYGMAGGSVTDWHLYDSHYTERFMDLPSENPEGYKNSSVLNYVDRYKGMLQIVHGTMDDNVHMQNSMQLVSALEDKKKDFELMLYPNGRHGWAMLREKNQHFENLKIKFIYKYLLEKPVPKDFLK